MRPDWRHLTYTSGFSKLALWSVNQRLISRPGQGGLGFEQRRGGVDLTR